VAYTTQVLDSRPNSVIHGRFYVPPGSNVLTGMAFKLARMGDPGDLLVRFGSTEASADLGVATIHARDVYPVYDFWYEAMLDKPLGLDPTKTYFFEIATQSGLAPRDSYTVFGPVSLGGKDFPPNFGLSFRTFVRKDE